MTDDETGGQRRIDRVLAADSFAALEQLPIEELRTLRAEADQEEVDQSYLRRLLQGRIDVVRAEQAHRSDGGGSIVDHLARVLTDDMPTEHGFGRRSARQPSRAPEHRRGIERVLDDVDMDDVQSRTDEEIARALAVYAREERAISTARKAVQRVLDRCDEELARRHREGAPQAGGLPRGEDR